MANDTVIIGCKLPAGLVLEVGLQVTEKDAHGNLITSVKRGPNYKRITLKGWNAHTARERASGIQLPAGVNITPYLNHGVDKAAWDEWKDKHKDSWLLKNEILFEAKDAASAQPRAIEGEKTPAPFAPIDPKKGALPSGITTADFVAERGAA